MYFWKQLSPSTPHRLSAGTAFGMTDTGTVRPSNEDNFLIEAGLGLVAVADGMGGHDSGEVASAEALGSLARFLRASTAPDSGVAPTDFRASPFAPEAADPQAHWSEATLASMVTLHDAVEFTNQRMYQTNLANRRGDGGGMGTTLTGVWQAEPGAPLLVFHVGDSRLYRYRAGQLTQLTRDQTMYQEAVEAGATENLPPRNLLLQAIGPSGDVRPELHIQAVQPGDLYLLCSDGMYGATSDERIAALLADAGPAQLGDCCKELIATALRDGSRDNVTVVLFYCD
ncbi:PP2C family protein-serine/threonine phosphatase [Massilia genomosp. 1]|nr:protein phosphatase 2C domain-containing protein [Massilia genomosp. 1]